MKEFTKDFSFSHDGHTPTEYKAGDDCTLTGFALKCAEKRDAVEESKEAKKEALPEGDNKALPGGDNKALPEGDNKAKEEAAKKKADKKK